MRSLFIIASLAAIVPLAHAKSLPQTTDRELKTLCFNWYSPTQVIVDDNWVITRHPEARRTLESFPRPQLLARLRKISGQKIHANDFGAIHFVLAYWGSTPAKDASLMLQAEGQDDRPSRIDFDDSNSPYKWIRDYPFELSPGLMDSMVQLYQKRPSPKLMQTFFRFYADGAAGYGAAYLHGQMFRAAPYDYVRAARDLQMLDRAVFNLTTETQLTYAETIKTLDLIRAEKSSLSKTANELRYRIDREEAALRRLHG